MRRFVGVIGAGCALLAALCGYASAEAPATIRYCHGYGCKLKSLVAFSATDMQRLKGIVTAGRSSAAAERQALGKADQWYERHAGAATGTANDGPKGTIGGAFSPDQLDCIDESTNTTAFLKLIESRGWLKHHKVGKPKARGFLLDLRYPHNTATVIEHDDGEAWVIDSWIPANAEFPDIMPLKLWVTKGVRGQN